MAAAKAGLWGGNVSQAWPRVNEIPFDSDRKRMTTIHEVTQDLPDLGDLEGLVAFVKGAPDIVLQYCDCVI